MTLESRLSITLCRQLGITVQTINVLGFEPTGPFQFFFCAACAAVWEFILHVSCDCILKMGLEHP